MRRLEAEGGIASRSESRIRKRRCRAWHDGESHANLDLRNAQAEFTFELANGTRRVLPAFGTFAGGLILRGAALERLSGGANRSAHVMNQAEIYAVPNECCLPD